MKVKDVMTSPAVTVSVNASLKEAIGMLLGHGAGSVVVTEVGVVGILTKTDALRAVHAASNALDAVPVSNAMTDEVVTIDPSVSVGLALRKMEDENVKKLPVVRDFELIGILTMTDIARQQPDRMREIHHSSRQREEWTA